MINHDFLMGYGAGKAAGGGGGGGGGFELVYDKEFNVNTTSTSMQTLDTIIPAGTLAESAYYYYIAYDLDGLKDDHFFGNEGFVGFLKPTGINPVGFMYHTLVRTNGSTPIISTQSGGYGVYLYTNNNGLLSVSARYNASNSKTVDGKFKVKVWKMDIPFSIIP